MISNIRPWLIKVFVNTEAVAVFSVAQSFFEAIKTFMPNSTLSTLIPFEINDKEKSSNILVRGTKYLVIISLIFALAGLLIASPIVSFVFPQYKASIPLFQLFLLVLPIVSFRMMAVTFLVALRRQKFLFFASSIEIPIAFLSSVVLLYLFGVWGMVLQRIFITLIMGGLMYTYLLKQEYSNYRWKNLFTFNQEDKIFIKKIWGHCLNLYKGKNF
jgi:O-antigen/teichoic acid export membrane protein